MAGPMPPPQGPMPPGTPGAPNPLQQMSPQQIQALQEQFKAAAAAENLTPEQFAQKLQQQMQMQRQMAAQQQQQQQQQQAGQQGSQGQAPPQQQQQQPSQPPQQLQPQQVPIQPGPPKPEAIAVAKFLKSQDLKSRPCILQEKRKDLFKVKRAMRALQSPAYEKARKKQPLLPSVTDRTSAEQAFKLLPLSMLAIRVSKVDPAGNPAHGQAGHQHGAKGGKKGMWTVRVEPQQDAQDNYHYVWFYEGSQWRQKAYAVAALLAVVAVVLFPLWPLVLRQGVWYLSMACLGLLAAFFGLAIVRLIIFLITIVTTQPGIWIYPNLFEDVGFFDSFKPSWAWRETKESVAAKKAEKKAKKAAKKNKPTSKGSDATAIEGPAATTSSGVSTEGNGTLTERKPLAARVEEVEDE